MCWLLTWFAQDPFYLYASRLIGGFFGAGGYMIIPIFLIEVTDDSVRGLFLTSVYTSENVGFLIAYIIGNYFDYYAMPLFSIVLTAIYMLLIALLPETPTYLMRSNKIDVSRKSVIICQQQDFSILFVDRRQNNQFVSIKTKKTPPKVTSKKQKWKLLK